MMGIRWGRGRSEAELLDAVRRTMAARGIPAEGLDDEYLREGVRRLSRALDEGRLTLEDLSLLHEPDCGEGCRGPRGQ